MGNLAPARRRGIAGAGQSAVPRGPLAAARRSKLALRTRSRNAHPNQRQIMKWPAILSLALAADLFAAEDKPTFTDPVQAGPDYVDQGEYKNDWGGAQIIALGDDKFRMVTYRGGLPGDGWDKEFKQEINGKRDGGKIVFTSTNNYRAELAAGKITINSDAGGPWTMEKTERHSPTEGAKPPAGAIVLFDGTSVDAWQGGHMDDRKLLAAGPKTKAQF